MRKFTLRNNRQQHLAIVFYFFENQVNQYIGIIISLDPQDKITEFYKDEPIDVVIASLAIKLNIKHHDYIEV